MTTWAPGQTQPSWPGWRQVCALRWRELPACLLLCQATAACRRCCSITPATSMPAAPSPPPPAADIARRERGSTGEEGDEGVLSGDSMDLEGAGSSRALPSPTAQSAQGEQAATAAQRQQQRQQQQQDGESTLASHGVQPTQRAARAAVQKCSMLNAGPHASLRACACATAAVQAGDVQLSGRSSSAGESPFSKFGAGGFMHPAGLT